MCPPNPKHHSASSTPQAPTSSRMSPTRFDWASRCRKSQTLWRDWASQHDIKSVYDVIANYQPGIDAQTAFNDTFTAAGGKVLGSVSVPIDNVDFSAYIQRVKDAHPAAVFVFVGANSGAAFDKAVTAQNGAADPQKTMAALAGLKWMSPRGPVEIGTDTRDIVQNIYLRRTELVNGKYENVEFQTIPMVNYQGQSTG